MTRRARSLSLSLPLSLGLGLLGACRAPDHRVGVYVEHPQTWGASLIAIHDGTFSDDDRNIRIRTAPLVGEALVANLEYPTSGPDNRDLEPLLAGHVAFLLAYLDDNPEAKLTLAGFSQGGCVVLDVVTRLATQRPELLGRMSIALIAPARGVRLGRTTAVAKHMIARCSTAENWLVDRLEAEPDGPLAALIGERTWIAWSCTDKIVGHDTFTRLHEHVDAQHVLIRKRLGHVQWVAQDQDPSREGQVFLASEIALAISKGLDPRAVLEPYGGFDPGC